MKKGKFLLIGWDAADWDVIAPLLSKGLMPNLKKMIDNGVYGNMSTMDPPYSPMLWSTVATGKTPDKHGVLGFLEVSPDNSLRPVTAHSRKSRAVWNILHNQGLKSNIVSWWPSFPAEPINGVVVTDKYQKVGKDLDKLMRLPDNSIHPKDLVNTLKSLRMHPSELTQEHILPFIPGASKIDQRDPNKKDYNGLIPLSQNMAEAVSVHNAATYLLQETDWDFMAVYYDYIDHMCHSFMKFHPPQLDRIGNENFELYHRVIDGAYRFQDMMLGRTLQMIDDDTTVVVMSDHGFESGYKRILDLPKVNAAPALDHRQFGIFVAMGPNIKKNKKVFGLSLIDIAPTILNHFDLSIGKDMDGKAILEMYEHPSDLKYIESWEDVDGDFAELDKSESFYSDDETMQQLIDLGYVSKPDEKIEKAVQDTRCDLKHNLARVYVGKKDYHSGKKLLEELIEEGSSRHIAHYYIDLMNICLKLKEYKRTKELIDIFRKIKTDVNFNLHYIEADLLIGLGDLDGAILVLKKVLEVKARAELLFKLGEIYRIQKRYANAINCFENALKMEPSKAKYNNAMSEVSFEIKEYEDAVEYALTSIELVKYFPAAHYNLGKSLEKLGNLENAKIAYETAAKLRPTMYRAKIAGENVEEKLVAKKLKDKTDFKYRDDQITIVSGLPRSGTSLMMQMLTKGGIEPLTDKVRQADKSNPKGYFEYSPVMSIHKDNSWLDKGKNKSVKIVAPLLKHLDTKFRYKIIFMQRNLNEIIKSQHIMAGKASDILPIKLYNSYVKLLEDIDDWKENEPGVEIIYIDYKEVLDNPEENASLVEKFVGKSLDKDAMASCIDKKLYRNRSEGNKA